MKCWICGKEMKKLKYVPTDFCCECGGQYTKRGSGFVFLDKEDNIISNPIYKENKEEKL